MRKAIFTTLFFILIFPTLVKSQESKPVIGVSSDCVGGKVTVKETYTNAILRAGGIPLVLPQIKDSLTAVAFLDVIDGLLLSGGEDVNPLLYGEQPEYGLGDVNPTRDHTEILLLKVAHNNQMPVLGICRGEQIINAFYGGTLYQDIPTDFKGNPLCHSQNFSGTVPSHLIHIMKGSHLSRLLNETDSMYVNSFHHQAVKEIAPGFKVVAQAPDGVIEGIEGLPDLNVIGVQFHPEYFATHENEMCMPLFRDLIKRAFTYKKKKEERY